MCLMNGRADQACKHKKCWEYAKYPQFNSGSKAITIDARIDFTHFKKYRKGRGYFILALNPYQPGTAERSGFKKFEKISYLDVFGEWPDDRDLFDRSEIGIEFVQYAVFKYFNNPLTRATEKQWSIDVKEAAVFIGSIL